MDVLFAFTGYKFAVVVSDTSSVQQIIVQKDDMERSWTSTRTSSWR